MKPSVTIRLQPGDSGVLTPKATPLKLSTSAVAVAVLGAIIGGGVALAIASMLGQTGDPLPWLAGALGGALGFIWLAARKYERAMTAHNLPMAPMTLTVTEHGMDVETQDFTAQHAWRSFRHIDELPDHLVIRSHQSGDFIMPRRDFASPEDAAAFVQALRDGIAQYAQSVA